ncbi:MAG: hypothetical protein ACE5GB_06015 [Acidimicrobiales bacterium]
MTWLLGEIGLSMLLAVRLGAERFIITTSVERVYEDYYSDDPRPLAEVTAARVRELVDAGQFAAGSMGPKMEAVVDYLDAVDGEAIICLPEDLVAATEGRAGTHITR